MQYFCFTCLNELSEGVWWTNKWLGRIETTEWSFPNHLLWKRIGDLIYQCSGSLIVYRILISFVFIFSYPFVLKENRGPCTSNPAVFKCIYIFRIICFGAAEGRRSLIIYILLSLASIFSDPRVLEEDRRHYILVQREFNHLLNPGIYDIYIFQTMCNGRGSGSLYTNADGVRTALESCYL